jgi:hypothetical protein
MVSTKHGNKYSNQEWAEMMARWSKEADFSGISDIKSAGAAKLIELAGIDEAKAYGLACRIFDFGLNDIQFSSPEKKEAFRAVNRWMEAEYNKLED